MSAPKWITPAGLVGVYPAQIVMSLQLEAEAILPATTVSYKLLSGALPDGMSLRIDGLISGLPGLVSSDTTSIFVIRVTDNLGNLSDRTFSIRVSGDALPTFSTPEGLLLTTQDSIWQEIAISYDNPIPTNPVNIRVLQGSLPPGLEINEAGLIRGYPEPPIKIVNLPEVTTFVTATDATNNYITVIGTNGFVQNRPISFSGTPIGNLSTTQVYYIKSVINATQITISTIPGGDAVTLTTGTGFMNATLPETEIGQPTKRQYSFTLQLTSPLGNDSAFYSIVVINQNLSIVEGGPGKLANTRNPTVYNTRPPTYDIAGTENFGYYVLPPDPIVTGMTYPPTANAYIGQFLSDNYFSFKILGHDFDGTDLRYSFAGAPSWMTVDTDTGWVYGTPSIPVNHIQEYGFTAQAIKVSDSNYSSPVFKFTLNVANNITGDIIWVTDSDLGVMDNATVSDKKIEANCDVTLSYQLISGELPPNLSFKSNGEIDGVVAYQPTDTYQEKNDTATYTFTIRAYSQSIPLVSSTKEFTLTIKQTYDIPTDNLYIKCTPSIADREKITSLLDNTELIPTEYLFRPDDPNYGKANNIVYAHAYGVYSSDIKEYIEAVKKNHYWRNITLGELNTAIARDENNNILYEVLYSTVIDNLQKYEPAMGGHHSSDYDYRYSESVSEEIFWPRFIDLNLGPWYASSNDIYTSYIFNQEADLITNFRMFDLLTQTGLPLLLNGGVPTFYTSLTPGYARVLYPNSLENMRKRVEQELGADYNFKLLPLWMTSQQIDGNTLGFTPAWVIAYTKIPEPITITAIETSIADNTIKVSNTSDILVGGTIIFSNDVFGGLQPNKVYYVIEVLSGNKIKVSTTKGGSSIILNDGEGSVSAVYDAISYANVIKDNIQNDWPFVLNQINFQIDRFSVSKTLTYNYDTLLETKSWTRYPSATPVPDPVDSQDFYVLFPQKTILPNKTQYKL
jgi:hypothetical protein